MTTKFPNMSKSEILALARECSASLTTIGAAELERLAKAEGSSSTSESTLGKGSVPPEGSSPSASSASSSEGSASAGGLPTDGAPPAPEGDGAMPPAGPEGAPSASPEGVPPAGPEGAPAPGAEGAAPAGPSFEELVSLYAALPPPDLEAHAAAMQQAMSMKQGASAAPAGAPPAPGADAAMPPAGGPPPMGKGETVATADPNIGLKPGTGTPAHVETANPNIGPTKKAESDIADLKKTVEGLGQVLETILTAPTRKATTGITYIPMRKSEPAVGAPLKKSVGEMTRDEVHAALTRVCGTPKLTKAERAVVDEYYLNPGSVKLADLEPIINKA